MFVRKKKILSGLGALRRHFKKESKLPLFKSFGDPNISLFSSAKKATYSFGVPLMLQGNAGVPIRSPNRSLMTNFIIFFFFAKSIFPPLAPQIPVLFGDDILKRD